MSKQQRKPRKARSNRSASGPDFDVDPTLDLSPTDLDVGRQAYTDWHWGITPTRRVIDWNDPDMPRMLIECGRLIRLHFRAPRSGGSRHPRRQRDTMIQLNRTLSDQSHIAFDPDHAADRLYLLLPPAATRKLKEKFWDANNMPAAPLGRLAAVAGGMHGKMGGYPNVMVKPIGICTAVVYYTHKKGDETGDQKHSYYIHQMAEVSGAFPFLCVDAKGRLWLAGGNTTAPNPGITD